MLNAENTISILDNMVEVAKSKHYLYKSMFLPLTKNSMFPGDVSITGKVVDSYFVFKIVSDNQPAAVLLAQNIPDLLKNIETTRQKLLTELPKMTQGKLPL